MSSDWDARRYQSQNAFVWQFGEALIDLLDPQPGERVLDLGCGAGQLTAKIAERGAEAVGIDSSPAMIAQARANFPALDFRIADATSFDVGESFDAVFSNAVLHWVHDAAAAIERVWRALKPGGRFVAEMGGKGNTNRIVTAAGVNPWFYPSVAEYASLLEQRGFEVRLMTLFDRPTKIEGESGLEDWLKMFGAALTDDPHTLAETLRPQMYRDGVWTIDYRRLRFIAIRTG